jgi:hypothetical protein
MPALPAVPKKAGPARDRAESLCRCPSCAVTFADYDAFYLHRPKGRCLTPEAAGLTPLPRPYACWGRPKETT